MNSSAHRSENPSIIASLATEYENLINVRLKLGDECQVMKQYILSQVKKIQTISQDIEKIKAEIHNGKNASTVVKDEHDQVENEGKEGVVEQEEESICFITLVEEVSLKHGISVSLFAEILDHSVICSTAFSPDGCNLAIGSNKILRIYNFDQDAFIVEAPIGDDEDQPSNNVRSISWAPDSKKLICGTEHQSIYVLDISKGKDENPIHVEKIGAGEVFQVIYFPDEKSFVSATGDGSVQMWDAQTYEKRNVFTRNAGDVSATSLALSPDQKILAAGYSDSYVAFWDIDNYKLLFEQKCHDADVYSILFVPGGKKFITSSLDKTIKIWAVSPEKLDLISVLDKHTEFVLSLAIDPSGQWLISGSKDLSCIISRIDEGRMLYRLNNHTNSIMTVSFNPKENMFCTGSGDNYVKIWKFMSDDSE